MGTYPDLFFKNINYKKQSIPYISINMITLRTLNLPITIFCNLTIIYVFLDNNYTS